MAVEIFPESSSSSPSLVMSPRISFSYDLHQNDTVPVEQYIRSTSPSSSMDFDFCVFRENFDQTSSTADELFFDGKILPIEIKRRLVPLPKKPPVCLPPPVALQVEETGSKTEKKTTTQLEEKQTSKSWFKRSTSLNCGSGYAHTLCPLPLLSRSNSTGSTGSGKRSNNQKQSLLKTTSLKQSQSGSSSGSYSSKPPLKKSSNHGLYGNGVKSSHVLNVPPANLFGLGSIFSGNKTRKKVIN